MQGFADVAAPPPGPGVDLIHREIAAHKIER